MIKPRPARTQLDSDEGQTCAPPSAPPMLRPAAARALARRGMLARVANLLLALGLGLPGPVAVARVAAPAAAGKPAVLVLGDSLSAEYGLPRGTGWVSLLPARLQAEKLDYQVVNASISGDTTSGGLTRLPPLLAAHHPRVVVIELGSNDGLRGLPIAMAQQNLTKLVQASKQAGARVLLVGMQIPPNYGRAYTQQFQQMFGQVAREQRVELVPFLLDGVAEHIELFQPDHLHPVAQAQPRVLDNVWKVLGPMLRKPAS